MILAVSGRKGVKASHSGSGSVENEEGGVPLSTEFEQRLMVGTKHLLNVVRGAVPATDPDDSGRGPSQKTQLVEIRILGDDCELMGRRVIPDLEIIGAIKTRVTHMNGAGKQVIKAMDKAGCSFSKFCR